MAQEFKETAHLNIDQKKFADNFEKIFGKQCKSDGCKNKVENIKNDLCDNCREDNYQNAMESLVENGK